MTSRTQPGASKATPTITFIVPVYNMERYIGEFLDSLDRQAPSAKQDIEVVFVDDGSWDASSAIIDSWARRTAFQTSTISQQNAGLSAARNSGIDAANGTWVSFPDPDDILSDTYAETVLAYLDDAPRDVGLVCTNILLFQRSVADATNSHPLRHKFAQDAAVVNLDEHPGHFHLSAATAFMRRQHISHLRFDSSIKPHFEDGDLIARSLLERAPAPRIALLSKATYYYRRPPENSSMVQTSHLRPEKYTTLLRNGYIGLLEHCAEQIGFVPRWVEYMILYDYSWILRQDEGIHPPSAALGAEVLSEFHNLSRSMMSLISDEAILTFKHPSPSDQQRLALLAIKGSPFPPLSAHETQYDSKHGIQRVRYFYQGLPPREKFISNRESVLPKHAKSRSVRYLGRELFEEKISWVDARRPISLTLDDNLTPIMRGGARVPSYSLDVKDSTPLGGPPRMPMAQTWNDAKTGLRLLRSRDITLQEAAAETASRLRDRYAMLLYRTPLMRRRYKDAWLLIDRDNQAQDNAEHLYRYLRSERPEINAFFVLSPESPDWKRLSDEGFRLIPINSVQHLVALKNCVHLVSSQVDHYIVRPLDRKRHGNGRWKFTFLQHGVTKDDCARWFNRKPIDLLVTATPDETASITDDGSPYVYTSKETKMTGFPRHDALLEKSASLSPGSKDTLLIMPSWRESLLKPVETGNLRTVRDDFWESEYVTNWLAVLNSDALHRAAERSNLRIVFMPHPNMQPHLTADRLPPSVELRKYSDGDLQDALVRAKIAVTDYSSIIFDAVYVGASAAYFQFDRESFFDGSQPYQRGYFDYETQGFGPVGYTANEFIESLVELVKSGPRPMYVERVERTFPNRDGRNCERVTHEIENL